MIALILLVAQSPVGQFSLKASDIWSPRYAAVVATAPKVIQLGPDANGRSIVYRDMTGPGLDEANPFRFQMKYGDTWLTLFTDRSRPVAPGVVLPAGQYRVESDASPGTFVSFTGYWAPPTSDSTQPGQDAYPAQDRIWSFISGMGQDHLTVTKKQTLCITWATGTILKLLNGSYQPYIAQDQLHTFPGVILAPGNYRVMDDPLDRDESQPKMGGYIAVK